MKFGVREICDVVLKAKANQKVGNKLFYKGEPVIYFDTLKTSSMEGAATTVYAQGGRGNSRLMAWEGERTVTFTMEDALISPAGFMILSGAGLIEGSDEEKLPVHVAEQTDEVYVTAENATEAYIVVEQALSAHVDSSIYVMIMNNGEIESEPFIGVKADAAPASVHADDEKGTKKARLDKAFAENRLVKVAKGEKYDPTDVANFGDGIVVMADYYTDKGTGAQQIEITPDKFGGNYYLEASTLFRDTNGVDMPAEFIIPNCKIQSNFTFTMASSGDPSTFTFTMDAFPDYTRFNKTKKVLAAIQIINEAQSEDVVRTKTAHDVDHDKYFN
jgi:hypothetical protein